jgi:hypothetical protein
MVSTRHSPARTRGCPALAKPRTLNSGLPSIVLPDDLDCLVGARRREVALESLLEGASAGDAARAEDIVSASLQPGRLDRLVAIFAHDGLRQLLAALLAAMEEFDAAALTGQDTGRNTFNLRA